MRARGFTLIEVMAVMMIVGIVLIAIVPALDGMVPSYRMTAGARKVASTIELAQSEAIGRRKEYAIAYDLDHHTYWLVLPQAPGGDDERRQQQEAGDDAGEGLMDDLGAGAPSGGGDQRPLDDLEHGPPPPDPAAAAEVPAEEEIPEDFTERDALAPTSLGEGVQLSLVVVGDEEHRSGVVYVPFSRLGDAGSHVVGLRLDEAEDGDGRGEIWVEFNALTRTIQYHDQRPERRTLEGS